MEVPAWVFEGDRTSDDPICESSLITEFAKRYPLETKGHVHNYKIWIF